MVDHLFFWPTLAEKFNTVCSFGAKKLKTRPGRNGNGNGYGTGTRNGTYISKLVGTFTGVQTCLDTLLVESFTRIRECEGAKLTFIGYINFRKANEKYIVGKTFTIRWHFLTNVFTVFSCSFSHISDEISRIRR